MSSEILIAGGEGATASAMGEFHVTLTIAGDIESLPARLAEAAEKLGYRIISDEPLIARRGAIGSGLVTSAVLNHARTLSFRLKPAGAGATQVTFNYVGYPLNFKGPRSVITREAEAIAAIATARNLTECSVCGASYVGDSRFCRRCGAPVLGDPPELEILRISNEAHAGTRDLTIAAVAFPLAVATFLLILGVKGVDRLTAALIVLVLTTMPSIFLAATGFTHLWRSFAGKPANRSLASGESQTNLPSTTRPGSLPHAVPFSVTDGTTELLAPAYAEYKERGSVLSEGSPGNENARKTFATGDL